MSKVCIITLGCKVNQYESEALCFSLKKANFEVETKLCIADYYIINSCAVTNEAEHKSREQISKVLRLNPNAKIFVCGCSSELHPESFLQKSNVSAIVGTENKLKLVDAIINHNFGNLKEEKSVKFLDSYCAEPTKTRAHIKIQDGCNNFCSYCIIPYTRGRERSRTISSIKKELSRLAGITKEIVLVGINIAGYGKDLKPKRSLTDVAKLFHEYPNVRLRFSSWEMGTITEDLLVELKKLPNFCPFFHISLQSGNNNVLAKMNRHYTFNDYHNIIKLIYKYFPNAAISTDVIAGFPTETEEDFIDSLNNIKKINFANLHAFPYSKREGTVAAKYKQINGTIVKERTKKLLEIAKESKAKYIEKNIGITEEVLVEEIKHGFFVGYTKNYIKTYIAPSLQIKPNEIYKVKLISKYLDGAIGELIWQTAYFVKL